MTPISEIVQAFKRSKALFKTWKVDEQSIRSMVQLHQAGMLRKLMDHHPERDEIFSLLLYVVEYGVEDWIEAVYRKPAATRDASLDAVVEVISFNGQPQQGSPQCSGTPLSRKRSCDEQEQADKTGPDAAPPAKKQQPMLFFCPHAGCFRPEAYKRKGDLDNHQMKYHGTILPARQSHWNTSGKYAGASATPSSGLLGQSSQTGDPSAMEPGSSTSDPRSRVPLANTPKAGLAADARMQRPPHPSTATPDKDMLGKDDTTASKMSNTDAQQDELSSASEANLGLDAWLSTIDQDKYQLAISRSTAAELEEMCASVNCDAKELDSLFACSPKGIHQA